MRSITPYPALITLLLLSQSADSVAATSENSDTTANDTDPAVWTGELETFYRYDDNIYAEHNQTHEDQIGGLSGNLGVKGGDKNLSWNTNAGFQSARHETYSSENYNDYWFNADLQHLLTPNTQFKAGLGYNHEHESRSSPDLPVSAIAPTEYDLIQADALLDHRGSRFEWRLAGTVDAYDFSDNSTTTGVIINNDDRDRTQATLGLRISPSTQKSYRPFVQLRLDQRNYNQRIDDAGYIRDSNGYRLDIGTTARLSPNLTTEAFIGQLYQNYDDARFGSLNTLDLGARLSWHPTPTTRLTGQLKRTVEETTLPGASGYVATSIGGKITSRITPKDTISTGVKLTGEDYQNLDRNDVLLSTSLGYRHLITPKVYLDASYTLDQHNSSLTRLGDNSGAAANSANVQSYADYDNQILTLTLGMRLGATPKSEFDTDTSPIFYSADSQSNAGLYGGLMAGSEMLSSTVTGGRGSSGTDQADYGDLGTAGGAFLGYGKYYGPWYLGLEGAYLRSSAGLYHKKDKSDAQTLSVDSTDQVRIDLRLGHALPGDNLVYAKLGGVHSRFDTYNAVNSQLAGAYDGSDSRWGVGYGMGLDIPTGTHTFIRLDYSILDPRSYQITYTGNTGDPATAEYDPQSSVFTLGVGWRMQKSDLRTADASQHNGLYVGLMMGSSSLSSQASGVHQESGTSSNFYGDFGNTKHVGFSPVIGYAWDFAPWQLAAELDADLLRAGWNHNRQPTGRDFGVAMNSSTGASLRAGYRLNQGALLFATAGAERARFNTDWIKGGSTSNYVSRDDEVWGLRFGVGAEIPVGRQTALRVDYSQTHYDDYGFTTTQANADTMNFDNTRSRFRAGLIYYF